MTRLIVIICLSFVFFHTIAKGQVEYDCGNFEFYQQSEPALRAKLHNSVLKLVSEKPPGIGDPNKGTGYVISVKLGLVVTAAHVLEDSKSDTIVGFNSEVHPGHQYLLKVISNFEEWDLGADLALLQVVGEQPDNSTFADRFQDINLSCTGEPSPNESLYRAGFKGSSNVSGFSTVSLNRYSDIIDDEKNKYIVLNQRVSKGESGSPIFNEKGLVIGTLIRNYGREVESYAIPSGRLFNLMTTDSSKAIYGYRNTDLQALLRIDSIDVNKLRSLLSTKRLRISNLELFLLIKNLIEEKDFETLEKFLITPKCVVHQAFTDRRLASLYYFAVSELLNNSPQKAVELAKAILAIYTNKGPIPTNYDMLPYFESISIAEEVLRSSLLGDSPNIIEEKVYKRNHYMNNAIVDEEKAKVYYQIAKARLLLEDERNPFGGREMQSGQYLLGAIIFSPENGELKAKSLELAGDIFYKEEKFLLAAKAYSTSLANGNSDNEIRKKWDTILERKKDTESIENSKLKIRNKDLKLLKEFYK